MAYLKPFNIDGSFQEPYTPAAGRVTSTQLTPPGGSAPKLEAVKFMLITAGNITYKPYAGEASITLTAYPVNQIFPLPVKEISAATGSVVIIHDGVLAQGEQ